MAPQNIVDTLADRARLAAVRSTGLLDTPPDEAFDRLTRLAAKLTGAPVTFLSLVDENRDFYKSCFGFPEPLASERELDGTTFCHYAIAAEQPLVIDDTLADPQYRDVPTVKSLGVRAYLGIPMVNSAGQAIGSFCAIDFQPRAWRAVDVEIMRELAMSTLREIELRSTLKERDAERRMLHAALAQMPAGVIVVDADGKVMLSNEHARSLLGYDLTDTKAPRPYSGHRPDGTRIEPPDSPLTRCITEGESITGEEIWYEGPHGRRIFLVNASPVRDADGEIIAGVVAMHDVTASRQSAIEREELMRVLDSERAQLRTLLDQVPAGVLVAEAPSGRIVMGNERVQEILGHPWRASQGIETYGDEWHGFHEDGRPIAADEWPLARALRGETVRGVELQYLRRDGQKIWIRIDAAPFHDAGGTILGGIVAFYDIDVQREMLTENLRLYREAERANQAKDEFFAALSHELRTPMTSILGWARLLKMEEIDNPTAIEAADAIESSAKLQAQLVDDLLDASRIKSGKIALTREPVDVNELIDDAVRGVQPSADSHGIRIWPMLEEVPQIHGDRARLRQVVNNLLTNAVKFTPQGGLIEVATQKHAGGVAVIVRDTGRGIDPALLPLIFERGSQASDGEKGGLGLGLHIVRHLVELHGGEIRVESAGTGRGATFTVLLPVSKV